MWRSRVYQRPNAQGIGRHAAYRVRDTGGRVVCSLWALGTAIEDTLELDEDGHVVKILEPPAQPAEHRALPPEVADGIGAIVAATSAPALGPALRAAARRLTLTWAPLHGELASMKGDAVRLSNRLRAVLAASPSSPSDAARRDAALATLTEVLAPRLTSPRSTRTRNARCSRRLPCPIPTPLAPSPRPWPRWSRASDDAAQLTAWITTQTFRAMKAAMETMESAT